MMNFAIERIAMSVLGALLVFGTVYYAGYSKGKHSLDKVIEKQVIANVIKQADNKVEVKQAGENYEAKFKELETKFRQLGYDFGRLRVPTRYSLPKTGTNPATSIGASATAGSTNGPGTGEINLDGIAAKVIELGADLDKSNTKNKYLQDLLISNQKACTVQ